MIATLAMERDAQLSPDGKWLAYASDESGRSEVHVRRFPSLTDRRQASAGEGSNVVWARNGRELIYLRDMEDVTHEFGADGAIAPISRSRFRLSQGNVGGGATPVPGFDVGSDGRIPTVQGSANEGMLPPRQITLVLNWVEELKAKVAVR